MEVTISDQIPSIYHTLHDKFGVEWDDGVIITHYPLVHCKFRLADQKIAHEAVHLKQQRDFGREAWWKKYIEDVDFRLSQEVEAYRTEVNFLQATVKDREKRNKAILHLARDLGSSMYGNIVSPTEALKLIYK